MKVESEVITIELLKSPGAIDLVIQAVNDNFVTPRVQCELQDSVMGQILLGSESE